MVENGVLELKKDLTELKDREKDQKRSRRVIYWSNRFKENQCF